MMNEYILLLSFEYSQIHGTDYDDLCTYITVR